ncbi:MAG: Flp family type IVb pilin [Bdellovibrionota bacterium]
MGSKRIKKWAWTFLRDESGQSMTEYVLLLFFVVIAVRFAGKQLRQNIENLLNTTFQKTNEEIQRAD